MPKHSLLFLLLFFTIPSWAFSCRYDRTGQDLAERSKYVFEAEIESVETVATPATLIRSPEIAGQFPFVSRLARAPQALRFKIRMLNQIKGDSAAIRHVYAFPGNYAVSLETHKNYRIHLGEKPIVGPCSARRVGINKTNMMLNYTGNVSGPRHQLVQANLTRRSET